MRVAIVASPFAAVPPKKYGGTERVIYYLIKGLLEKGHEPILIGTGDSEVDCEVIAVVNKAIFFPKDRNNLIKFNLKVRSINRKINEVLEELVPTVDIIHSHKFDLLKFADFPNVTTLHDPFLLDRPKYINNFSINYYRRRKKLFYISISKNQQRSYPDLKYIRNVYNGEDPRIFPIIKRPSNYLCFIGRFDREKNPHMAIQLAVKHGIPIKLAGKVDYGSKAYFKEEIKPYLDNPLVEFLGELDQKESIKLISRAKANLHPTGYREPFGLTVMEAAYCGTPTLAVSRGSMPELIRDGKTGILVEDFVEGFHRLNDTLSLNREHVAKWSRKKFNYQNMTEGYVHAYHKVIKELS